MTNKLLKVCFIYNYLFYIQKLTKTNFFTIFSDFLSLIIYNVIHILWFASTTIRTSNQKTIKTKDNQDVRNY